MLLRMCMGCGRSGCDTTPCKPFRKTTPRTSITKRGVDRDIAKYPPHVQAMIRAKLSNPPE